MTAVSGSSTQPSCSHSVAELEPGEVDDLVGGFVGCCRACAAKATTDSRNEMTMDPMASEAAGMRLRLLQQGDDAGGHMGRAGISHRFWTIQIIQSQCAEVSLVRFAQPFMEFIWSRSVVLGSGGRRRG